MPIKSDEAEKQLAQWMIRPPKPGDDDDDMNDAIRVELTRRMKKAPVKLRKLLYRLFERDDQCEEIDDWEKANEASEAAARQLAKLSKKDLEALIKHAVGKPTPMVLKTWNWLAANACDCESYDQKPIRISGASERVAEKQADWLKRFVELCTVFRPEAVTLPWLTVWAPHLLRWIGDDDIGYLIAAHLGRRSKEAKDSLNLLREIVHNEHPIGQIGDHVLVGALASDVPEAWQLIDNLLIAARRQEGLRQSILMAAANAHPDALARLLQLICEHKLSRFSSITQALDEWLSWQWSALAGKVIADSLETLADLVGDPAKAKKFLQPKNLTAKDASDVYLALWACSVRDAKVSLAAAKPLVTHKSPEVRYATVCYLVWLELAAARPLLAKAVGDEDVRIAIKALDGFERYGYFEERVEANKDLTFASIEALFESLPAKAKPYPAIVWPWTEMKAGKNDVADFLFSAVGKQPATALLKYRDGMNADSREQLAHSLGKPKKWSAEAREAILELAGDTSADVREAALNALAGKQLSAEEAEHVAGYLKRKSADLRSGIIKLLLDQKDAVALGAATTLTAAKNAPQRLAGLELLRCLSEQDRCRSECVALAGQYEADQKRLSRDERVQLDAITASDQPSLSLANGFGLLDPSKRTPVTAPKKNRVTAVSAAARTMVKSLDDLIHKHRKTSVTYKSWDGKERTDPLAEADFAFGNVGGYKSVEKARKKIPLLEIWEPWFDGRGKSQKDSDGLEVMRAFFLVDNDDEWDRDDAMKLIRKSPARKAMLKCIGADVKAPKLRYEEIVTCILRFFLLPVSPSKALDYLLDVTENLAANVPKADLEGLVPKKTKSGQEADWDEWEDPFHQLRTNDWLWNPKLMLEGMTLHETTNPSKAQWKRVWQLFRWLDEPVPEARRLRPSLELLAGAYVAGVATIDDVTDHLVGPRPEPVDRWDLESLSALTSRRIPKDYVAFAQLPEVASRLETIRDRVLDIELSRGESETTATSAAMAMCYTGGETLVRIMRALGKERFKVDHSYRSTGHKRSVVFTELAKSTYPREDETAAEVAKLLKKAENKTVWDEERLIELSFLAPQWAESVAATLGWPGFLEAFYWYMAHMRYVYGIGEAFDEDDDDDFDDDDSELDDEDDNDGEEPRKLSAWERLIRQRTPLTESERGDGAIDVAWFHRVYAMVKPKQWEMLAGAAKLAASAASAKRAQLISEVLRGKTTKKFLVDGIKKKHLKDYVRLLGLLPLAKGKAGEKDLLDRYQVLQEYEAYAKKLGSMSRPGAMRAVQIGMQNLAATAGFPDPIRLQWSMEAEATKDLSAGPIVAEKGDVTLELAINVDAEPELSVRRGDKVLKSIPAKLRKEKAFVALRERSAELKKQSSRVGGALERSMCRRDAFTGAELQELSQHAVLWPKLQRLVLVGEGVMGYPDRNGRALRGHDGKIEPVKKSESLRIAHPYDLLKSKQWPKWQRECFATERIQPFKQIFRELYVVTAQEKKDKTESRRYAAHQVNPRQANRLWGSRDWTMDEYDMVFKTFHQERIRVDVSFDRGYTTPLEYEGLTIEAVRFVDTTNEKTIPLSKVPPVVFSEAMRDMDLVVSVAHVGGVDPEATASTVEMREQLIKETCRLLNLKNVKLKDSRAMISGTLGDYSVHLGSGVVHRQPGGSLCLVPVHSQHRGRLFLPFADNDPRTAEVVSKTLLLARDGEIQDPIILEQLRE